MYILCSIKNIPGPLATTGLSAPVPRGRKGRKKPAKEEVEDEFAAELAKLDINPEQILVDNGYKKHLKRHANK